MSTTQKPPGDVPRHQVPNRAGLEPPTGPSKSGSTHGTPSSAGRQGKALKAPQRLQEGAQILAQEPTKPSRATQQDDIHPTASVPKEAAPKEATKYPGMEPLEHKEPRKMDPELKPPPLTLQKGKRPAQETAPSRPQAQTDSAVPRKPIQNLTVNVPQPRGDSSGLPPRPLSKVPVSPLSTSKQVSHQEQQSTLASSGPFMPGSLPPHQQAAP